MQKDPLNVHAFQNRAWGPFAEEKNMGVLGYLLKKRKLFICRTYERVEAATSSYSVTGEFLRYTHSVLVAKNHQKIRSKCLVDEFSFTDIF